MLKTHRDVVGKCFLFLNNNSYLNFEIFPLTESLWNTLFFQVKKIIGSYFTEGIFSFQLALAIDKIVLTKQCMQQQHCKHFSKNIL